MRMQIFEIVNGWVGKGVDLIYRNQRNHILENADKLYVDSIGLIFLGKSQMGIYSFWWEFMQGISLLFIIASWLVKGNAYFHWSALLPALRRPCFGGQQGCPRQQRHLRIWPVNLDIGKQISKGNVLVLVWREVRSTSRKKLMGGTLRLETKRNSGRLTGQIASLCTMAILGKCRILWHY